MHSTVSFDPAGVYSRRHCESPGSRGGFAGVTLVLASGAAGARNPQRRHGSGLRQARGTAAACAGARAARGDARRRVSDARARSARPRPRGSGRCTTPPRCGSSTTSSCTKATRRLGAPRLVAVRASLPVRQVVRVLRRGARARHRTAAAGRHRVVLEPGAARRAVRIPDSVGPSQFSIRPEVRAARPAHRSPCCGFCRRAAPCASSSFIGDPGLVRLDPRWHQAALRFVRAGLLPHSRRHRSPAVSALPGDSVPADARAGPGRHRRSRVAHSITLIASAYDLAPGALWFPPLIETLIAMSIVYMALENIVGAEARRAAG